MTFNTRAIILRRDDFDGPDSRLLLLSDIYGKLELIARGLRKSQSKLAAHARPGVVADCFIVQGRKHKLFAGSLIENWNIDSSNNLDKLYIKGAVLRITDALTPYEQKDEVIFNKLETVMTIIDSSNDPRIKLVPFFYAWQLVAHNGYAQQLDYCLNCKKTFTENDRVFLSVREAGLVHDDCFGDSILPTVLLSVSAVKGLKYMVKASIEDCLKLRAGKDVFKQIINAITAVIEERYDISTKSNFWKIRP